MQLPAKGCIEQVDCRTGVHFDESPWPPGGPGTLDYYGDCRRKIRCER